MAKKPNIPWIPISALFTTLVFGWTSDDVDGLGWFSDLKIYTLKTYNNNELFKREVAFPIKNFSDLQDDCESWLSMTAAEKGSVDYCSEKITLTAVLFAAFGLAFVGVLETVLAAKIAGMRVDRSFHPPQEMAAFTVCGFMQGIMGVMPTTGLFLRCNVNVTQGATHRMSQFLNSLFMLVVILAVAPQFSFLPQFAVAAILVTASLRMVPYGFLAELWAKDRAGLSTLWTVTGLCLILDPAFGLLIGIFVAHMQNAARTLGEDYIG